MNLRETLMKLLQVMMQAMPDFKPTEEQINGIITAAEAALAPQQEAVATMTPDALATAAAPVVGKALLDFVTAQRAAQQASEATIKAAAEAFMRTAPPVSQQLPAFTGSGQPQQQQRQNQITDVRPLKYAHLSAEDMSFLVNTRRQINMRAGRGNIVFTDPEEESKFLRELADKAGKAYQEGKLKLGDEEETGAAIKSINFMKANELDHSTQASFGDEWVPDLWASQIWERARLDNVILPLFRTIEMPSNPFEVPTEGADPTVHYVPETTNENQLTLADANSPIPDSKVGSGKVQLNAKKLALRVGMSEELVEDSIIPVLSIYREQAQRAITDTLDNVVLNGDTETAANTNINLIDGTPGATARYLAFNGLRKLALVTNADTPPNRVDAAGANLTLAMIRQARFTMGSHYSINPKNLAIITHGAMYAKMLGLSEFITMDKAGNLATAMTGQIGFADGMPVLVSAEYPLTNSAGKVPAAGGTLGSLMIVYRNGWYIGYRRKVKVNVDYIAAYDSYQLTASVRLAFVNFDTDVASAVYNALV